MSLAAGVRLGPYEIVAPLGAGGMGEVYRARDTRLDRTVAIKVLASHLAASAEVRQRFEREARAISALNHPHICVLHDIGCHDEVDFLVMEYLDGETLADRLRKGPLPIDQVLRYGIEIAEALDKAHRQGIVHRDLKPGNIMLTKAGTKLLDFGLAKLHSAPAPALSEPGSEPTAAQPLTTDGTLLGTVQYMAPEQLEGKEPDARTDIFALAAMLYEMATGKRAFTGNSQASLIAAILDSTPARISTIQPLAPPAFDRFVSTCLAKDPDDRWQNAHDVAHELRSIAEGGSQAGVPAVVAPRRRPGKRVAWATAAIAAALAGIAAGLTIAKGRHTPEPRRQVRFQIDPPENTTFGGFRADAVSPDGELIAFVASGQTAGQLYVRALNSLVATRIDGSEFATLPFWSPDGRQLGFFSGGKLYKVDVPGGRVQLVCDARTAVLSGASWGAQGTILFSSGGRLFQVPASGGTPAQAVAKGKAGLGRRWPHFLPDGRRYLYSEATETPGVHAIYAAALDSDVRQRVVASDFNAAYSPSGHLLFGRGTAVIAQAFNIDTLEVSGEPFPVAENVALFGSPYFGAGYSVSRNGVLAWRTASGSRTLQLTWFDRSGRKLATIGEPAGYSNPALSPDGRRVAVGRMDSQRNTRDIWILDVLRGTSTRLTFHPADDTNPTWSPDGTRIAFTSDRTGIRALYQKLANGSGDDEPLLASTDWSKHAEDWSRDGRFLLYNYYRESRPADLFLLPLAAGANRQPIPFLATEFLEHMGRFAPNGRWIAYVSDEGGPDEVYVRSVGPDGSSAGGKWQISTSGGLEPMWRGDGKELFFLSGSTIMAVEVNGDGASFEAGTPKRLFDAQFSELRRNRYVVARDGQRFLVNAATAQGAEPIQVLVNWLPPGR